MGAVLILAFGGLVGFVSIVLLQHLLVPELTATRHFVSEYANEEAGPLMTAGFVLWAGSLAATAIFAHAIVRGACRHALTVLLGVAAAGMLVTASFETQTVAGDLPGGATLETGGRLHDLGSGVAQLALVGAAVTSARIAALPQTFRRGALVLLMFAVAATTILLTVGEEAGGLRQRVLLAIACIWQGWLLTVTWRARTRK